MCKMVLVVCDKKLAIRSLLLLMFAACSVGSDEFPSQCTMARPRSLQECIEKERRFWYKESEGRCEPIGICLADVERLDESTANQNYFITMEDCEKGCFVCPRLKAITNGNVSVSENRTAGSTASYTCSHGYILVESSTRTCLSSGNWSGTEPYCQEVQCPHPELTERGHPSAPLLTVGSTSIYTCDEGYTLIGNAARVCMTDGSWSGSVPFCGRVKIEYNSKDVTNSVLNISVQTSDVNIECKMEPVIALQNMTRQEWRVTNGDNFPFPFQDENVLHQPTLTYKSLFIVHENNYTCKIGELEATVFLEVFVPPTPPPPDQPPMVVIPPRPTIASPQDDVFMICVFKGCPQPNVTWFHNNESVYSDERRLVEHVVVPHDDDSPTYIYCALTIKKASMEDGGEYRCLGKNSAGSKTSDPIVVEIKNTSDSVKRSTDEQSSESHCNTDSSSVTVVGKVRRSRPQRSGQTLQSYRVKVSRVLRNSASYSKERKSLTMILNHNPDTIKLKRDATYILTGRVVDNNFLFVSSDNLIHLHSPELEDSIRSC